MNILKEKADLEVAKKDLEQLADKIEDAGILHDIYTICSKIEKRIKSLPIKEK